MDMMQIRRQMMGVIAQMAGSPLTNVEFGTFTIAEDSKTYTINHNLGVVPNFCIVYPIDVPTTSSTYRIAWQVIACDIGQQNWNIDTNSAHTKNARHAMSQGTNYAANTDGVMPTHNIVDGTNNNYAGHATISEFVIGGQNNSNSGGTLAAGTFGYILGRVPTT